MGQPTFVTSPSYDSIHYATIMMVREARTLGWMDAVLAPSRGGLLMGVIASHKLNVPLIPLSYSSKSGRGDDKNHSNLLPTLPSNIKTIFLIDDICDSGNSLKEITEHYQNFNIKVITAVIHYKAGSIFHPDLYYWKIDKDSPFICYPYENT